MYSKRPHPERVHASERLLCTRPTFSETVMVSVGVSKLGCTQCTELFFCRAGGENIKINGAYNSLLPHAASAEVIASH